MPAWMFPGIQQKTTTPWVNLAAFFDRNPEEHHLKQHHLKQLKHLKQKQKQKQKLKHHSLKQMKNAPQAKNQA